ncbi:MAG: hypothetical protein HY425_03155 [Candidatus Levybacteria bacterium]|nr:hypothetical protein [Candidatus Levybacteria bacterium]
MLTKSDLSQMGKLIRDETTPIIQQELAPVKQDIASLKKDMKYIKKTVDVMIDLFDRQDIRLSKRVDKTEAHLGLTTP